MFRQIVGLRAGVGSRRLYNVSRTSVPTKRVFPWIGLAILWIAGLLIYTPRARAGEVTFTARGWQIGIGDANTTLTYPLLLIDKKPLAPADVVVEGAKVTAKYANGTQLEITGEGGTYSLHFTGTQDVKEIRLEMSLPISMAGTTQWSANGGEAQTLPEQYSGKPMLFKGDAKRMVITAASGDGFSIAMPYGYQQLQDNREWKDNRFVWFMIANVPGLSKGEAHISIRIAGPEDTEQPGK